MELLLTINGHNKIKKMIAQHALTIEHNDVFINEAVKNGLERKHEAFYRNLCSIHSQSILNEYQEYLQIESVGVVQLDRSVSRIHDRTGVAGLFPHQRLTTTASSVLPVPPSKYNQPV